MLFVIAAPFVLYWLIGRMPNSRLAKLSKPWRIAVSLSVAVAIAAGQLVAAEPQGTIGDQMLAWYCHQDTISTEDYIRVCMK